VVWMYVVHEFEDALMDCNDVALKDNDNAVHAWDEGVAFYTGSLEGPLGDGAGQLLHALADKRCANFDTCGSNGTSSVNSKLEGLFQQGEKAMAQGKCDEGALILEQIKPLMTIPLIQGALRYAYKSADGKGGAKEIAEGWAFAAAVLPQVDAVNPAAAATIRTNMEYGAVTAVVDGYSTVFEAFQSVYAALGVTCEDIGGLLDTETTYIAGLEPCTNMISNYEPGSDVLQHSRIDLDVAQMGEYLADQDYTNAGTIYTQGENSLKSEGMRTLKAFSDNSEKLKGEAMADMYAAYWGNDYSYAHKFVDAALAGTGLLAGAEDIARKEVAMKGVQYQVVWMYVVHEFEDAIADCLVNGITDNADSVHAWDEGVAFYTGSLEGPDGSGNGQLLHALADKRCANFNTCDAEGLASVNVELLSLFQEGEEAMQAGECDKGALILKKITPLMTIPLIQGALRYAYKADPVANPGGGSKERAEGWAFTAAVLPQIDAVNPAAAATIRKNMDYSAAAPVVDGYKKVYEEFKKVYAGLGIDCNDVGGLIDTDKADASYYEGTECVPAGASDVSSAPTCTDLPRNLLKLISLSSVVLLLL